MTKIPAACILALFLFTSFAFAGEPVTADPEEGTAEKAEEKDGDPELEALKKRLAAIEKKLKKLEGREIGDRKAAAKLEIGFELELEWLYAQRGKVIPAKRGQLDKFTMDVDARFMKHFSMKAQGRFESDEAWVKTAYGQIDRLPYGQRLRFGKDKRLFKLARRTESYPLIGTAFWRTNDVGISYRFTIPDCKDADNYGYLKARVATGLSLTSREAGEQDQYYIIADRKAVSTADIGENEEYTLVLGGRFGSGRKKFVDMSLFGMTSKIGDDDASFLNLFINPVDPVRLGTSARNDNKWRRGAAVSLRYEGFFFQGMYIFARDCELYREGYYVQPSYRFSVKERDWLRSIEILARAGRLLPRMDHSEAQPMSWDRDEFTAALLVEIHKGLMLKMEYTVYDEDAGPGERPVKNNEFLFQLECKF
ncbi:MAG: hypothetical protein E3J72_02430 [Planctomycetota bacterium]|nr:MAG: hypothetical protein E3J72_02430 [Planctomycetota bacterium]